MTGERLFLRYAFPCVDARLAKGLISEEHTKELSAWVKGSGRPTRRRLKYCFPNAFKALRELGQRSGREPWSLENVEDYWHNNHKRSGDCAVRLLEVEKVEFGGRLILVGEKRFLNGYGLELAPGDKVYVHRQAVIEKLP